MNEQTRIRLEIIAARFGLRCGAAAAGEAEWLARYDDARRGVLRTAMTEIGEVLVRDGHRYEVRLDAEPTARSIDFAITPAGAGQHERRVRFFARNDPRRGWQVVAELWLSETPSELLRFEQPAELTAEAVEHVLVDALEQLFAAAASIRPRGG